ncbi:hypothetical protein K3162_02795 [Qipengyuania xiapuensis]|uniref:Uncharacterized protein n=1 Tax=Qipengyuania xiapuensis TaxID=2867236 RepID=A0ABX8ZYL4_9SPHN|nr:hypothetical protein [Qipengyuania xiapuensis]QZD92984.1 hypothetical protein K3162_02795 [Qipengyuania xiapuensis]
MEEIAEQGVATYFVGNFNPSIVTPHWLFTQDILTQKEADKAEVEVIHKDLSRFAVSGLKFEVTTDRFHVFAEAEPFIRLCDIAIILFKVALPHTPIKAALLNYYIHARLESFDQRLRFGRKFAPVEPWGDLAPLFDGDSPEKMGGLVDLTMQMSRKDDVEGLMRVILQPSNRIPEPSGIFVQVTNSFEELRSLDEISEKKPKPRKSKKKGEQKAEEIGRQDGYYPQLLVEHFDEYLSKSKEITENLLRMGLSS